MGRTSLQTGVVRLPVCVRRWEHRRRSTAPENQHLQFAPPTYFAAKARSESKRQISDAVIIAEITQSTGKTKVALMLGKSILL